MGGCDPDYQVNEYRSLFGPCPANYILGVGEGFVAADKPMTMRSGRQYGLRSANPCPSLQAKMGNQEPLAKHVNIDLTYAGSRVTVHV